MKLVRYRITKLNKDQKNVLDCHQIVKNRYLHTGRLESEVEFGNYQKHKRLSVLPEELAFKHERYFDTDYPCNQSWERPIHYHYIGRVDFLGTTTYCDKRTKSLLSTAGYSTRPNINYRYRNTRGETEAVCQYWLSEVSRKVRVENRLRRAWRNLQGEDYVDPYLAEGYPTSEETERDSDMDEDPTLIGNIPIEQESAPDSEEEIDTEGDISEPIAPPRATVVPQTQEEQVEAIENRINLVNPEDYVTQDEETYQHYYRAIGSKQVKTEGDTEGEV